MARKTKAESEQTKQQILDAALEEFHQNGFNNTTLEAVAKRAGFTRGALYHRFTNKTDLFMTLAQQMDAYFDQLFLPMLNESPQSKDEVIDLACLIIRISLEDPKYRKYVEVLEFGFEWALLNETIREYHNKQEHTLLEGTEWYLTNLKNNGLLKTDIDPNQLAITVQNLISGVIYLTLRSPDMLDPYQSIRSGLTYLFEGVGLEKPAHNKDSHG